MDLSYNHEGILECYESITRTSDLQILLSLNELFLIHDNPANKSTDYELITRYQLEPSHPPS